MSTVIHKPILPGEYSNKDLQKSSFVNENLSNVDFSGSDLRGADFTDSDLSNANFSNARTGIPTVTSVLIFIAALAVSILSGFFAMLVGKTIRGMLASTDQNIRMAGIATIVFVFLFIAYAWWKGGKNAITHLLIPAAVLAMATGFIAYLTGAGTGWGALYLILAFVFLLIMFIVGTVARSAAGAVSNILFVIVALSGGMFGKSIGGGLAAVILAVACAMVSKRALSGAKGFGFLQKIASSLVRKFGTSFRNTKLTNANFNGAKINNTDFSNAQMEQTTWDGATKMNYITMDNKFTPKLKV